jgi:hypothetical protein
MAPGRLRKIVSEHEILWKDPRECPTMRPVEGMDSDTRGSRVRVSTQTLTTEIASDEGGMIYVTCEGTMEAIAAR